MYEDHEHRPTFRRFLSSLNTTRKGIDTGPLLCKICGAEIRLVEKQRARYQLLFLIPAPFILLFMLLPRYLEIELPKSMPFQLLCVAAFLILNYASFYLAYRCARFEKVEAKEEFQEPWEKN